MTEKEPPVLFTSSLKKNYEFRRVYSSGKSAAMSLLAMYCKKNRTGHENRLGFTVSTKVGNAVTRNRVRRKLKEIYRLHEAGLVRGFDIVVVARIKSRNANYWELESGMLKLFDKLRLSKN